MGTPTMVECTEAHLAEFTPAEARSILVKHPVEYTADNNNFLEITCVLQKDPVSLLVASGFIFYDIVLL